MSTEKSSPADMPSKLMEELPIRQQDAISPIAQTKYQRPYSMSKKDSADIHKSMLEELRKGKYRVQIAPSDLVDFGGQRSFDMTHQLFIQQKGAFLLLLDGRKDLNEVLSEYHNGDMTTKNILLHWVNSILTYCSPDDDDIYPLIAFAATHSDELTKDEQHRRTKEITQQMTEIFSDHEFHKRIKYERLFFINATDREDAGVKSLKEYLVSVAFQQKSWGEKMPISWVPLELQMAEMRSNNIFLISVDELNDLNLSNDDLSLNEKELKHFLRCQHSFGQIMYFHNHRLDQYIIVQPTSMVDILRSFITDEIFWPSEPALFNILSTASKQGIIKKNDLYQLWSQEEFNKYVPSIEIKEFTAQVLVHLDILVEPKRFHEIQESLTDTFIVPCIIRQHYPFSQFPYNLDTDRTIFLSYKLLKSTLPNALVYKLIGAVLNIWPLKKENETWCLYDKAAILTIDKDNELYLIYREDRLLVGLSNAKSKTFISPDVASIIQECLTLTLIKVLNFYFTSFGQSPTSLDVVNCFETEVVVECGEETCFTPLTDIKDRPSWTCPNEREHDTKFHLYWVFDQKQEETKGFDTDALNLMLVPEDKHLVRLAKQMGVNFNQFIIHLGLTTNEWDNIKENNPTSDNGLTQRFIGLCEWKKHSLARNKSPTFFDLSKALMAIEQSEDIICTMFREPFTEVYAMNSSRLFEIPEDDVLRELSQNIGFHTFELGIELGLGMTSIEETVFRYSKDMFGQTYDILLKWKANGKVQPNVRSLMLALQYVDPRGFHFLQEKYALH